MNVLEKRVLARTAMREYNGEINEPIPGWIGDLAYVWNNGWRLTGPGWQALNAAAAPRGKRIASR